MKDHQKTASAVPSIRDKFLKCHNDHVSSINERIKMIDFSSETPPKKEDFKNIEESINLAESNELSLKSL